MSETEYGLDAFDRRIAALENSFAAIMESINVMDGLHERLEKLENLHEVLSLFRTGEISERQALEDAAAKQRAINEALLSYIESGTMLDKDLIEALREAMK